MISMRHESASDGRLGEHRDELVVRTRVLAGFVFLCLGVILASYWRVQILEGAAYRALADHNRFREQPIRAPRGLIYDRGGRLLVENVPSYNLYLDRSRSRDVAAALGAAASILGRPRAELATLLERYRSTPSFTPVLLAENLSLPEVARFGVAALEHPEFEIEVGHVRLYRQSEQLAHILGYLGEVSADDLASGRYRSGEWVGKKGLEQTHDAELRGEDGTRVFVVDSRGRLLAEHSERPARSGAVLRLTIDLALQQEAERSLAGQVGAVVALDPRDGAVLAMASAPSFDPNRFARRLQVADWRALIDSPFHPLQNRAFQNTYPPGSVFKPIVALAALGAGISPRDSVYCTGATRVYNHVFRCWKRDGHGRVDLHDALRQSCDVYFYHLAPRVGIEAIAAQARALGLGTPTGIDLAGEKSGLVPDPRWSLQARRHPWYPGETVSVAIGQGPLLTTPLQMATAIAALANGGELVTPHLVATGPDGAPRRRVALDPAALALVRASMVAVVNEAGTGGAARLADVTVAGKTGTVQVVSQRAGQTVSDSWALRDHAWFVSFAPAEAPTLVVVVFVEHGGMGSAVAAPIAKRLYEIYFADDPGPAQPL